MHFYVELKNEKMRSVLASKAHFDVSECFMLLDKDNDGFITKDDLIQFCKQMNRKMTEKECDLLMQRYDRLGIGRVSEEEFKREITPRNFI